MAETECAAVVAATEASTPATAQHVQQPPQPQQPRTHQHQHQHQQAPPQQLPGKCLFYKPSKRRFCRVDVLPGQRFCGNHLHLDPEAAAAAARRVPCPIDPTHTVAEADLKAHLRKCPKLLLAQREQALPHYSHDINAGSDEEPCLPAPGATAALGETGSGGGITAAAAAAAAGMPPAAAGMQPQPQPQQEPRQQPAAGPFCKGRAAQRSALARLLGAAAFMRLVEQVERICGGGSLAPASHVLRPAECEQVLAGGAEWYVNAKHGQQQASIIGNMQRVGLLGPGPEGGAGVSVVELGAGKGYLGGMVAQCCGVRRLVVTDIQCAFQAKADRHLRHIEFARHRIDLKDYNVLATPELVAAPPATPWLAIGKHLCGAATDYSLRACLGQQARAAGAGAGAPRACGSQPPPQQSPLQPQPGEGCDGGSDGGSRPAHGGGAGPGPGPAFRGLAIAPCCHHRCGWRAYVGKPWFRSHGFSDLDFELVSWMTGWALCGHDLPPGQGNPDDDDDEGEDGDGDGAANEGGGGGDADACRGRATGEEGPAAAGSRRRQGPGGEAGAAGPGPLHGGKRARCGAANADGSAASGPGMGADAYDDDDNGRGGGNGCSASSAEAGAAPKAAPQGGPPPAAGGDAGAGVNGGPPTEPASSSLLPFDPCQALPRARRMALGQMCKQLIDRGRLDWLARRCASAELVCYVPPEVSGENRLLLATAAGP